jgi:leader peptidase (prepilin peptidase)/N-methyltransferase
MTGMRILAVVLFVGWSARLALIDVRERRLPNRLTALGAIGTVSYAAACGDLTRAAAGGAALTAVYLLVHLAAPTAFGAGDVKLAFALGAAAALGGARAWALAAVAAPAGTALAGMVWIAVRRARGVRPERPILLPHGPSMCAATLFALAVGS